MSVHDICGHLCYVRGSIASCRTHAPHQSVSGLYEDEVGVQDDESHLEDEKVLIVAKFAEHEVPVMKELSTNRETIPYLKARSDLGNHHHN